VQRYNSVDEDDDRENARQKVRLQACASTFADAVQITLDNDLNKIIETLKEKYAIGACKTHPTHHCFSTIDGKDHWLLDRPKLVTWAGAIVTPLRHFNSYKH
jgi:hypothetical protein